MGTRHLIAVQKDGEYKVAQYGQWDGYPEGQGVRVLEFLRNADMEFFKKRLNNVRFFDEAKDKDFIDSYNKNVQGWSSDPDNRTEEQKRWHSLFQSRDLGAKILTNIANSGDDDILLKNAISFAADSLFCEFAYVIDFDKNTFEVFRGFNKDELGSDERFASLAIPRDGGEYRQVKHVKTFKLSNLPTKEDFLNEFNNEEEETE